MKGIIQASEFFQYSITSNIHNILFYHEPPWWTFDFLTLYSFEESVEFYNTGQKWV